MLLFSNKRNNYYTYTIYYGENEKYEIFEILKIAEDKHGLRLKIHSIFILTFEDITDKLTEYILNKLDLTFKLTLYEILKIVSKFTNISEDTLKSKARTREIVNARFLYMAFARRYTKHSLASIAEEVFKHHASVSYAKKQVEDISDLQEIFISFEEFMKQKGLI